MAYFDSMSFNGVSGGANANYKLRQFSRRPENKEFVHPFNEMIFYKQNLPPAFDKVTLADFVQFAAVYSIHAAQGPKLWESLKLGRQEFKIEGDADCKTLLGKCPLPSDGAVSFRDRFYANGFTDEEMVALSYVYVFGDKEVGSQSSL